jgi:hypothetical protein
MAGRPSTRFRIVRRGQFWIADDAGEICAVDADLTA